ncbi:pyrroline-5-carboxylate reductase [Psychromonas sp. 14N.309.X.WAT.B.A12]|uniref:pyrroline-5-carboxylate reductase n=1 Tax=unclassified Psychromonas TaxID=2614957 RepID=UPI0025B19214|nr:pyrroline-5-carboxylate reductase [Psychromonas sp. 14N.309.X.WAT.B.A12]MDN2663299.1 pyrroline-5-carboxylate reductase [Psychromonas sp. 14N.309.X.WAT.B.A12]
MQDKKITFIGAGNMAGSIINGLVKGGYPANLICASAPSLTNTQKLADDLAITASQDNNQSASWADVIVLGVKPQMMADVCQSLVDGGVDFTNKLVISIAAGVSVTRFQSVLGESTAVIRTMPNTPSLLQKGMTGLFASQQVSAQDKDFASELMSAVGEIVWVEDEAQINGVIAAAGSAPAYFFLFMESMQKKAMEMGFSKEDARLLVQQSAIGSAEMVKQNAHLDLETLRNNVISKGGTTAEAIRTFNELDLPEIVGKAMQAASDRGAEMEKLF